jgi:hypothetical protein
MHCPWLGVGEYDVSSLVIWLDPKQGMEQKRTVSAWSRCAVCSVARR